MVFGVALTIMTVFAMIILFCFRNRIRLVAQLFKVKHKFI
jgi:hypothetical protein